MKKILFLFLAFLFTISLKAQEIGITTSDAYLMSEPSASSVKMVKVPEGFKIDLSRKFLNEWIPIDYQSKTLYLYSGYVRYTSTGTGNNSSSYFRPNNQESYPKPSKSTYPNTSSASSYINSRGVRVQSPTYYKSRPNGASALCKDGTYSFSQSGRGTCSRHGGVAKWY